MRFEQNVIYIVTWILYVIKLGLGEGGPRSNKLIRPDRFLIPTNAVFCNVCTLYCPSGYIRAAAGCYLCTCQSATSTYPPSSPSYSQLPGGGVLLNRPCDPTLRKCRLPCPQGYLLGAGDCEYCMCASTPVPPSTSTSPASTQKYASTITSPSYSTARTFRTPPTATTAPPTTQATYHRLADPCIASQKYCNRDCDGAYVKGPGGCEYCFCMKKFSLPSTTESPQIPTFANASIATIPGPSSEVCRMAKVICSKKCHPSGYISQPDDCLYCSCYSSGSQDDDSYGRSVSLNSLTNPCIQNNYKCDLTCPRGYVRGPRGCEFCTCK